MVLAIDCMHCAARTGGFERYPLAITLEEACAPDGACILVYEPRGFRWDAEDEPFVERIERQGLITLFVFSTQLQLNSSTFKL